jgi:regulator of chromosome condensation
LSTEAASASS